MLYFRNSRRESRWCDGWVRWLVVELGECARLTPHCTYWMCEVCDSAAQCTATEGKRINDSSTKQVDTRLGS